MLDLLFKNASVIDGSGSPAFIGDVGVKDGKITLNTNEEAKETVDCTGLTLTPGFVDSHSHGDMTIGTVHGTLCKICQGVTSEVGGQCGESPYPVDERFIEAMNITPETAPDYYYMPFREFKDLDAYAKYAEGCGLSINMATLIGHSYLRKSVMGVANRLATPEEMELMKARVKEAMEQGAFGLSTGLIYIPGVYSNTEELVELCKVMKPYGGVYATHMRNEAKFVVDAVKESIYIAEQAGVPLVISHHKICGKPNWGKSEETLKLVAEAEARGVKVMFDQYPYEANMTGLDVCIPPQYFSDGAEELLRKLRDPEWRKKFAEEMNDPNGTYDNFYLNSGGFGGVFISSSPNVPEAEGMMVSEYAAKIGKDPMDTYFDLLVANELGGSGIYFAMDINEVEKIYCDPHTSVGSDAVCYGVEEKAHPRAWGTFIRPLVRFAEKEGLVSFEEAVRKQTSKTADFWGLKGKGRIAEGYDADLVLLDRKALKETASFKDSNRKPEGIVSVYVAGVCAYKDMQVTDARKGCIVRKIH